ncbi:MAG: DNA polymerase III subunit delta' [Actinomycetota bacterium]
MTSKREENVLPKMWSRLVGQEGAVTALGQAIRSGSPGHAWLFVGPEGVGRRPAAFAFAAALNCASGGLGCGECVSCAKVLRSAHPDVHVVVPEGQQILVDQIRGSTTDRGVIPEAFRAPIEGSAKVFIIEDAALMNLHAANALLKVLEEPPAGVMFLLVTADPDALPETVVSRCRRIDFIPLGPEAIRRVLVEQHRLDTDRAAWAARVGGNLARALRLAFDPDAGSRRLAHLGLLARLASGDLAEAIRAAEEIRAEAEDAGAALGAQHERELADLAEIFGEGRGTAAQRKRLADRQKREARRAELDTYLYTLDDLATAYRDRLIGAVGAGEELMVDDAAPRTRSDPTAALRALELIEKTRMAIERNAAPRLALEALFADLGALPVS